MNILCSDVVSTHQPRQTGIPTFCTGDEDGKQAAIVMAAPTGCVEGLTIPDPSTAYYQTHEVRRETNMAMCL